MRVCLALLIAASSALPLLATAQGTAGTRSITVAIRIDDTDAGRVFTSGFASALRKLGDVNIVGLDEDPHYVIDGTVMCNETPCAGTTGYTVSIRLVEPSNRYHARLITDIAVRRAGVASVSWEQADSIAAYVWPSLRGYEKTHQDWVARWGRNAYEQAIRELVATIDTGCLEKQRRIRRMSSRGTVEQTVAQAQALIAAQPWIC
jgi:hypothetical protein